MNSIKTYLFLRKLKLKHYLMGEQWITVDYDPPVENSGLHSATFCYYRNERIVIKPNKRIKRVVNKYFIKDWKWKLYELLWN